MKLRHFSLLPVLKVRDQKQENPVELILHHTKPRGLWVSDEAAEQSWSSWCESESYGIAPLEHNVVLAQNANLLYINSLKALDDFSEQYGKKPDRQHFRDEPAIMWADVARDFDGILITPYQWERRLCLGSSWYYGWDCASGCIWRKRAVAHIEPILSPREAADVIEQSMAAP
jgi:hypothetical protein